MPRGVRIALLLACWPVAGGAVPSALPPAPSASTEVRAQGGELLAVVGPGRWRDARPLPSADFGAFLPAATVAVEDRRFFTHHGVDWRAVLAAWWRNLRAGRRISGGSTITQQLVKMRDGRTTAGWSTKWREAMAARALEKVADKPAILEAYLNLLDYGNGLRGPEAAALAYFGQPCRRLSKAEALYLAGLPQAPSRLDPWRFPEAAAARFRRNVARLAAQGWLAPAEAAAFLASPPVPGRHDPPAAARHLARRVARGHAGGVLTTTLDARLQAWVESRAAVHRTDLRARGATDCAVVVLDNASGEARAWFGGWGDTDAVLAPRACGSVLKPFLYEQALAERILTAATVLPDTAEAAPAEFPGYAPRNFSRRHFGPVRVREALGNSLNVPAVVALGRVGARPAFVRLQRWGLDFARGFGESGAGFILGNAEVTPLAVASAYAALARGGLAVPVRWRPAAPAADPQRVGDPAACALIADILCDPEARRRAFGAGSVLETVGRTAVKTGTSASFRDAWCAGFTGGHTVVVWVGNADGRPMDGSLAVRLAAPLWADVVRWLGEKGDPEVPVPGQGLVRAEVCALSGLKPWGAGKVVQEWFLPGTVPAEDARAWHGQRDGHPVWLLPAEYAAWVAGPQNRLGAELQAKAGRGIVQPPAGAVYALSPILPAAQQTLCLQANGNGEILWTVNGSPHARGASAEWPLAAGTWRIGARGEGWSDERVVVVTGP